jgi:molybdopterin-binding protein
MTQKRRYRISEAAELLGVSDDTVRRWIEAGRLNAAKDDSGRQSVDGAELALLAREGALTITDERSGTVSARNRFPGIVTRVDVDGLVALVEIQSGGHRVVSMLTAEAVHELGLQPGDRATAVIKATNVIVESR